MTIRSPLTLPKFRLLRRIKQSTVGLADVERNGNARRTFAALALARWIGWDPASGSFLILTPEGEAAYAVGLVRGWTARYNPHVERLRRRKS